MKNVWKLLIGTSIIGSCLLSCNSKLPYEDPTLSADERAMDLVKRLTLEEKVSLMQNTSPAIPRLGIKEYDWWNEALHGVGRAGVATVFPQCIGMAASFNDSLLFEVFTAVSDEARAKSNEFARTQEGLKRYQGLTFWTPNVNIFRDPRWGRGQETYGEDPYLTAQMGINVVRGLQGPENEKYDKLIIRRNRGIEMLTDRQRKVIKCILNHPKGIYAATIAEQLKVSDRTVRNDIASINMVLMNSQCMIQSSKRTGYFIMQENIARIRECLSLMDAVDGKQIASTPMERKYYMLGQLFQYYEMSLAEVAEQLYVSEQTIYKDLTSFIQLLKSKYHFEALTLENGKIRIDRDEVELRTLFYRIAKEEIYISNKLMDLHLYQLTKDYVDLEELNGIVDYVSCFCKGNDIILSDQLIYTVSWMIFFTMTRIENAHTIEREVKLFHRNEVLTKMLHNLLHDLRLDFQPADFHLLQNYVETLGFYSTRQGNTLGSESDEIADAFISLPSNDC